MNIDIVNKQVSVKLGIHEAKVAAINRYYWRRVHDHLYSYDTQPLNIENVCVLYVDKTQLKKQILMYVKRIRRAKISQKFSKNSARRKHYIDCYAVEFRKLWKYRKALKLTN